MPKENMGKKKEKTAKEFSKAYEELCKEYGFQINVIPVYKARDDGTWSTVLQVSVSELENS
jgi:hypothetical protein